MRTQHARNGSEFYGANVIKFERPDRARRYTSPVTRTSPVPKRSISPCSTHKRSLKLSTLRPRGQRVLEAMNQDRDVLVEKFGPRRSGSNGRRCAAASRN